MKKLLILFMIFSLLSCRTFRHTVVADDGTVTVEEVPIEEHVPLTPIEIVTPEEMDAIMAGESLETPQTVQDASAAGTEEITQPAEEEPFVPLVAPEPETPQEETPQEETAAESFKGDVVIAGTTLPPWFVYTASGLILAMLITVCYISKQKKESYWHRAPRD